MTDQIIAVTVLGHDRPGIVALLRGHFAMVLLVRTGASAEAVEAALHPLGADGSLVINARVLGDPATSPIRGPVYALRVHGSDRPGIVATITGVVARHDVNIIDLGTRLVEGLYILIAELQLPSEAAAVGLSAELRGAAEELGVEVHLSPIDDDLL